MAFVALREDFTDCAAEYRILSVSADHLKEIKHQIAAGEHPSGGGSGAGEVPHGPKTLLTLKGGNQLVLCDERRTFRVRRVEYSNSLLFAEERPANGPGGSTVSESDSAALVGDGCKHLVVCACERVFEAKPSVAYNDVLQYLLQLPVTLRELETLDADVNLHDDTQRVRSQNAETGDSATPGRLYTFPQLVALCRSSGRELAQTLFDMGAVVVNGHVRLLKPSLMREALRAALDFFDAYPTMTWREVVEQLCPSVYPKVVLQAVRSAYGSKLCDDEASSQGVASLVQVPKVLQALAASVLLADDEEQQVHIEEGELHQDTVKTVSRSELLFPELDFDVFYDSWVSSIPSSLFADDTIPPQSNHKALLKFLHGCVIVVRSAEGENYVGARVVWAPSSVLSTEISLRTRQLFEICPGRWEAEELKAYVEPLLDPGVAFDSVILRYAKEHRTSGRTVMYSSLF